MKLVFRFIILAPTVAFARDSRLRLIVVPRRVVSREIVQLPRPNRSRAQIGEVTESVGPSGTTPVPQTWREQ